MLIVCLSLSGFSAKSAISIDLNGKVELNSVNYPSGLQVVVVTNSAFKKDAICLFVKSGYYNDPKNKSGIAHLVEHTFHHVTQKNDFLERLFEDGGYYLALTQGTNTKYHFIFKHEKLSWVLDNIALFLSRPNFKSTYLFQELKVIEEEQKERVNDPNYAAVIALRDLSNPTHSFKSKYASKGHQLSDSEPETLLGDVQSFFDNNYQPNNMLIFLATNSSFKDAISQVEKVLPKIILENDKKQRSLEQNEILAFQPSKTIRPITLKEHNANEKLAYVFPLNIECNMDAYHGLELLKHLLSLKGNESFQNMLVSQGLSNLIEIEFHPIDRNQILFSVEFSLTEKGKTRIHEIQRTLFSYLSMVNSKVDTSIFEKNIKALLLTKLIQESNPHEFLEKLVLPLELNSLIADKYILWYQKDASIDSKIIKKIVGSMLSCEPIRISNFNLLEIYEKEKNSSWMTVWNDMSNLNQLLHEDKKSTLIFSEHDFTSFLTSSKIEDFEDNKAPRLLYRQANFDVWYKNIPLSSTYMNVSLKFDTNNIFSGRRQEFLERVIAKIYELKLYDLMDKFEILGGNISIENITNNGVSLSLTYPSSYHSYVIHEIENVLSTNSLPRVEFDNLVSIVKADFKIEMSKISNDGSKKLIQLALNSYYTESVDNSELTYDDYRSAIKKIQQSKLSVFIHGNLPETESIELANKIRSSLRGTFRESSDQVYGNVINVGKDKLVQTGLLWKKLPITDQKGKYLIASFHLSEKTYKSYAMLYLLRAYFQSIIFDYFRLQENPLYTAEVHSYDQGLQFILYSSVKDEDELSKNLDEFILKAEKQLNYFDFLKIRRNYVNNTWFESQMFRDRNKEYWRDIIFPEYGIDYRNKVKLAANNVTYRDFKIFLNDFLRNEKQKRQLNIFND